MSAANTLLKKWGKEKHKPAANEVSTLLKGGKKENKTLTCWSQRSIDYLVNRRPEMSTNNHSSPILSMIMVLGTNTWRIAISSSNEIIV